MPCLNTCRAESSCSAFSQPCSIASCRLRRIDGTARSIRCAARSKSRAANACLTASSVRSWHLYQRLARWCSSGTRSGCSLSIRARSTSANRVVAVPLPPIVQGDEEQVGALQGDEHVAPVVAASDGITVRPREPVENR